MPYASAAIACAPPIVNARDTPAMCAAASTSGLRTPPGVGTTITMSPTPATCAGMRVHQHRRRIRGLAARHVEADAVERRHALAELACRRASRNAETLRASAARGSRESVRRLSASASRCSSPASVRYARRISSARRRRDRPRGDARSRRSAPCIRGLPRRRAARTSAMIAATVCVDRRVLRRLERDQRVAAPRRNPRARIERRAASAPAAARSCGDRLRLHAAARGERVDQRLRRRRASASAPPGSR